jgi:hypothetical protein
VIFPASKAAWILAMVASVVRMRRNVSPKACGDGDAIERVNRIAAIIVFFIGLDLGTLQR